MSYCSSTEVRRRAQGGSGSGGTATTTAWPEDEMNALIEQASRYFDTECGVTAGYFDPAATEPAGRIFYGDGTGYLRLDPYVAGSLNLSITLPDGYSVPEFIENDGYLVRSLNGVVVDARFVADPWPLGVPITVTARWGYEVTPADVKLAIIELVLNLRSETDPITVKLKNLEGQPLRESLPPRVREIASRYRMKVRRPAFV